MGIEPTYAAWEAAVLPLNYARITFLKQRLRRSGQNHLALFWLYLISHRDVHPHLPRRHNMARDAAHVDLVSPAIEAASRLPVGINSRFPGMSPGDRARQRHFCTSAFSLLIRQRDFTIVGRVAQNLDPAVHDLVAVRDGGPVSVAAFSTSRLLTVGSQRAEPGTPVVLSSLEKPVRYAFRRAEPGCACAAITIPVWAAFRLGAANFTP